MHKCKMAQYSALGEYFAEHSFAIMTNSIVLI